MPNEIISIIIPAHNEEKVIGRTITELLPGITNNELEVIVVCNGCTDNTRNIVTSFGSGIKCIDTNIPSKTNALNLGDAAAIYFPRIYLDADVILTIDAVKELSKCLLNDKYMAASPKLKTNCNNSSLIVKAYYDVWQKLPYVKSGMIGTGVYALSKAGRKRFKKFPEIIGDDRFVRALFKEHERTVVNTCYSFVRAPKNLKGLLKIKTRSRLGGYEFEKKFPDLLSNEKKNYSSAIFQTILQQNFSPSLIVYFLIVIYCHIRAQKQFRKSNTFLWERDETSRSL